MNSPISQLSDKATRLYVTGGTGFVGGHVAKLVAEGVFGSCELIAASHGLDIRDAKAVKEELSEVKPDQVIHLAARSFVPASFVEPQDTFEVNLFGTLNILEALKELKFSGRMLYISSGDVYGAVPEEALPVDESRPPAPRSPYAVSKVSAELLCKQYHLSAGLDVIVVRPFNHIGPGQHEQFVVPGFAKQVARIAQGLQPPIIEVGDIDVTRDFCDVRDVVRAYAMLLRSGRAGELYNVASGNETTVRDILERLCALVGVTPEIVQDASRLRPSEQRRMVASAKKLTDDTGWRPAISLDSSLQQILETFRTKVTQ
ncbi:GDP-mannose 4,6-dehydratase [Dyella silvae]|uniref:GDP-mannose 4,6-dehydratase n=1 Tax=Dyella silvae TaxID=2994424 RepID=UPI002264ACC5|nr:GDP-mannose 4,6-dehydratase [Dyella silvae]